MPAKEEAEGRVTLHDLAKRCGVSRPAVTDICSRYRIVPKLIPMMTKTGIKPTATVTRSQAERIVRDYEEAERNSAMSKMF